MTATQVKITAEGVGTRVPSVEIVEISEGDEIVFLAAPDTASTVCFTEKAASILQPKPPSLDLELTGGSQVSFTIGPVARGVYCVGLKSPESRRPTNIACPPGGIFAALVITPLPPDDYPVGDGDVQTVSGA